MQPGRLLLAEDETDLLLFPLLRAGWSRQGEPMEVRLSGQNDRRVVFGALNLLTGERWFRVQKRQRSVDFQAFLEDLDQAHPGRSVALLLDEDPSHTAQGSQSWLEQRDIKTLWLPKRTPELNPMETLWRHAKDLITANKQYDTLDDQVVRFVDYLESLSDAEALQQAGVSSQTFWLKSALSKHFFGDA
jgi:hypothetical protein